MRAKKVDLAHAEVRDYLRGANWFVFDSAAVGGGFPDLVCGFPGVAGFSAMVEVKSGTQERAVYKLNDLQREFRDSWPGIYIVATSGKEAEKQLRLAMLANWKFK